MTMTLTREQVQVISESQERPVRLIDPQSKQSYVLLRAEEYERLQALLEDDFRISDAYTAQMRSALRAGWDDPALDDYNHYDEAYQKLCQSNEGTSS
ncbi:MAG TPA: hypothetical protein VGZ47_20240 [Gemmataceae bacterium]|jgi:hypothetical protein|nr:hypothetical protein [Gemmataceae bacterium]